MCFVLIVSSIWSSCKSRDLELNHSIGGEGKETSYKKGKSQILIFEGERMDKVEGGVVRWMGR